LVSERRTFQPLTTFPRTTHTALVAMHRGRYWRSRRLCVNLRARTCVCVCVCVCARARICPNDDCAAPAACGAGAAARGAAAGHQLDRAPAWAQIGRRRRRGGLASRCSRVGARCPERTPDCCRARGVERCSRAAEDAHAARVESGTLKCTPAAVLVLVVWGFCPGRCPCSLCSIER